MSPTANPHPSLYFAGLEVCNHATIMPGKAGKRKNCQGSICLHKIFLEILKKETGYKIEGIVAKIHKGHI